MLVFISCAKTMAARCSVVVPEVTVPKFETEAVRNALEMSQYSVSELERLLRVNTKIAAENRLRFHDFCSEENRSMPAVCSTRFQSNKSFISALAKLMRTPPQFLISSIECSGLCYSFQIAGYLCGGAG